MDSKRTDLLRPVELTDLDPRHVLQMEDAVLQKQYPAASCRPDTMAPFESSSYMIDS
jgi:hypothetical protein